MRLRTKIIFYLLSFPDVLNANGSRSYYSPLKAGSPAPLHNPLKKLEGRRWEAAIVAEKKRPLFLFVLEAAIDRILKKREEYGGEEDRLQSARPPLSTTP